MALVVLMAVPAAAEPGAIPGTPVAFADLPGFAADDHRAALAVFRRSCDAILAEAPALRTAQPVPPALKAVCAMAMALPDATGAGAAARQFFETHFTPRRLDQAFFTGYYEPVVEGSLTPTPAFQAALLGRPANLVAAAPGETLPGLDPGLAAGLRRPNGQLTPVPDRAAIEAGMLGSAAPPLIYVRDPVEAFFIHVQGSARVLLPDGSTRRLVYAGRNGLPYTSIGRVLVEEQGFAPGDMGMAQLKDWIRAHGQAQGEAGRLLMQRNRSYIFFTIDEALPEEAGPIGGAGVSLTALRSLAVDRAIYPYGLPFYADVTLPWDGDLASPFRRILVGQDTGTAIVGAARGDLFFGTGPDAARRAGPIRHPGTLFVLWPKI